MQVVAVHAPETAATLASPLMLWTSDALSSVFTAGAGLPELVVNPGMLGKVRPPVEGVGVEPLEPPHPAIPAMAPTERAPMRSCFIVIEILAVVCQRSLRAESPQMIAVAKSQSIRVTKSGKRLHLDTVEAMTFAPGACPGRLP